MLGSRPIGEFYLYRLEDEEQLTFLNNIIKVDIQFYVIPAREVDIGTGFSVLPNNAQP